MTIRSAFTCCALSIMAGFAMAQPPKPEPPLVPGRDWRLGIKITKHELGGQPYGVRVTEVFKQSPAADEIKLKVGDIIHGVDGKLLNDPTALREDIMGSKRSVITLSYQRGEEFYSQKVELLGVVEDVATITSTELQRIDGKFVETETKVEKKVYIPSDVKAVGEPEKTSPRPLLPVPPKQ